VKELRASGFCASDKESDALVREYLSTSEVPLCPACGEELRFHLDYAGADPMRIRVACPGCASGFTWTQPTPEDAWSELHVRYFLERVREGGEIRCPVDDCRVVYGEHSEGAREFRCPYCGRRRLVSAREPEAPLTSTENESIVFLIT
jgi:DNA-directed RNA polymerase subunit RPC12/RpoP